MCMYNLIKFGQSEVPALDIKQIIAKSITDEQTVFIYSEQILNLFIWTLIRCYLFVWQCFMRIR